MAFTIYMGHPEMDALWRDLSTRKQRCELDKEEERLFKKLGKTFGYLATDPKHNSLASHEITDLSRRYGRKVFQSYLENNTPGAGRLYWVYGPDKGDITVIAIEPHPEDQKRGAYERIKLSSLPPVEERPSRKKGSS